MKQKTLFAAGLLCTLAAFVGGLTLQLAHPAMTQQELLLNLWPWWLGLFALIPVAMLCFRLAANARGNRRNPRSGFASG